ncbi:hypothetical protein DVG78_17405 [Runella aurantiaca]|uniref:YjbH domain-containing protein n=2 Tax=Runella aurantiaca TaxID=2282308 RepID=A0A369IDK7_9BACT|nr:hypothetical protein DVG78_17405 [Runella aurantiaca]
MPLKLNLSKAATTKAKMFHPLNTPLTKGSLALSFVLVFIMVQGAAQTNLSGKPGLMYVPSAVALEDGAFRFGYNYNPIHYGMRGRNRNPERIWFAHLAILPRLEITATLLQMIDTKIRDVREGIGDRSMDIRYLLLKETKKRPSVAVVMTVPFTIDGAMLTHVVVATKNFTFNPRFSLEVSAGYGSPYFVYRNNGVLATDLNSTFLNNFAIQKKSEWRFKNNYLVGPFGGAVLHFRKQAGLMVEYDSQNINVGAYATLFKRWTVQAGWLNGDQFMFGTSFGVNLLKLPRQLRKESEK